MALSKYLDPKNDIAFKKKSSVRRKIKTSGCGIDLVIQATDLSRKQRIICSLKKYCPWEYIEIFSLYVLSWFVYVKPLYL